MNRRSWRTAKLEAMWLGIMLVGTPAVLLGQERSITPEQWCEDIEHMVSTLESEHPRLYHSVSEEVFRAGIDSLKFELATLDDVEVAVELARLIATIGDGHTFVNLAWDRSLPFRRLPVVFERASDGVLILKASPEYSDLLGARVLWIGRTSAADAVAAVRPLFAFDNEWTSLQAERYLLAIPEVLHARGITDSSDEVEVEVELKDGGSHRVTLPSVSRDSLGPLRTLTVGDATALWLGDRDDRYWLRLLPDLRAVYVQFNGADLDKEEESLAEFARRMEQVVRENEVDRLIIDLRWNAGGARWRARHLLNAVIRVEGYFGTERMTREREPSGRIFTIIGPGTFSAATQFALDLDLHTNTVFVGEPTGGRPNHYGEVGRFRLPNSQLEVRFSALYHQASDPTDMRTAIHPDIEATPSVGDFRAGRDAALEAIRSYRMP
jgi:hypothetical protein